MMGSGMVLGKIAPQAASMAARDAAASRRCATVVQATSVRRSALRASPAAPRQAPLGRFAQGPSSRRSTKVRTAEFDVDIDLENMSLEDIQKEIDRIAEENAKLKNVVGVEEEAVAAIEDTTLGATAHLNRKGQVSGSEKAEKLMNIVYVTSEVAPWSKTGGLGDVAGALPPAFAKRGHRVMVIAPRYQNGKDDDKYENALYTEKHISVEMGVCGMVDVGLFHCVKDGVDWVFIDHPTFHRPGNPYGDTRGAFGDNQFRFSLLSLVACEIPLQLELNGSTYGQDVVFFANDWHSSMVPVYISARFRPHNVYNNARTILCIHNLAHQGVEPGTTYGNLGLPPDYYGCMEWVFPEHMRAHELDTGQAVNIMKGALVTADRILTVSQGYAYEIATPEGGFGVDGLIRTRQHQLNGITNGVSYDEWNPSIDTDIPANFSVEDMAGKAICKAKLQEEMGLRVDPNVPLIGFIGRLDWQKGPDMIQDKLEELMCKGVQMIMLGSGDPEMESWMQWAENNYSDSFRGYVGFSVPMAHRITAGSDILLMPSRFEPCGLNQLYAMLYGTVPVAHATGGLRDTIEDFNPFAKSGKGTGTGWTFSPCDSETMMGALTIALETYREYPDAWKGIMERGMTQDFTWERAAMQYEEICEWALLDDTYA